jgi:hypothetical protein
LDGVLFNAGDAVVLRADNFYRQYPDSPGEDVQVFLVSETPYNKKKAMVLNADSFLEFRLLNKSGT